MRRLVHLSPVPGLASGIRAEHSAAGASRSGHNGHAGITAQISRKLVTGMWREAVGRHEAWETAGGHILVIWS